MGVAAAETVSYTSNSPKEKENGYQVQDHRRCKASLRRGRSTKIESVDGRLIGGDDTMIVKVGKPGSCERVEALRSQYELIAASGHEVSPFSFEG